MLLSRSLMILWMASLLMGKAVAEDWPHFLGPRYDLHSTETGLNLRLPPEGPPVLWEVERGRGHSAPVVAGGRVVFYHELDGREEICCVDADTGAEIWRHSYEVKPIPDVGIATALGSSPTIDVDGAKVYSLGRSGRLVCLDLDTGEMAWAHRLDETFGPSPFYFGYGSSPLVYGDQLIVQVGADEAGVVSFAKSTGEVQWVTDHGWNGSYASPIVMPVNGRDHVVVFAGGKVDPPHGGLLLIDPSDGRVVDAFPWRSELVGSINASAPVAAGRNRVFISESFGKGGVLVEYDHQFRSRVRWIAPTFENRFQTPIFHDGVLYGVIGNGGVLVAYNVVTGFLHWNKLFYDQMIPWQGRELPMNLGYAHLIHVDGQYLALTENGALIQFFLDSSGYRIGSMVRLFYAPESWSPPVLSHGRLYINQNELGSRLVCYDLRGGSRLKKNEPR